MPNVHAIESANGHDGFSVFGKFGGVAVFFQFICH